MTAVRKHVTGAQAVTLQSLARQMLDEAGGDVNRAVTKLDNYASSIKRYNDEFRLLGVRTVLNGLAGQQRATVRVEAAAPHRMSPADKAAQARKRMAGAVIRSALMEMEYQIGNVVKPLRAWRGVEIAAHGETQLATARTSARRAQFLILVGNAAGEREVGTIGDAEVERLHRVAMESGE